MMTCRKKWAKLFINRFKSSVERIYRKRLVKMFEIHVLSKILMMLRKTVAEQEFLIYTDVQQNKADSQLQLH